MPRRRQRQKRRAPRRRVRRRRPSLWRWLGLGALGLVGSLLLRRPRPPVVVSRSDGEVDHEGPRFELPESAEKSWIQGPGGNLCLAEVHPQAELAVVFVHGLGGDLEQWSPLLHRLGPAIHGVALDLPGHGGSDLDVEGEYALPKLAAALGAVIDVLGLRRVVIVAHSVGAHAAIELAGRRPGQVAGLLLVDPTGDQTRLPETQKSALRESLHRDPGGDLRWNYRQLLTEASPEVADRVLESVEKLSDDVARGILESGLDHSPMEALEGWDGPVRSLQSERNDMPWSLHRLRSEMPHRFLDAASHWLMMDRPQEVWEELVELLDELRSIGRL